MSVDENALLIFDEPTATFMPGQTITGRVVYLCRNPLDISSVTIKFRGKCVLSWTKWNSQYIGKQLYLKNEIDLFCDRGESQVGKYVFPFNFHLPPRIPSTFFCKYGYICYKAKVKICRPWKSDVIIKLMFIVLSPINLNNVPTLSEPQCALKEKSHSSCFFVSGLMKLQAYIPYSGFVPGQTIPVTVKLDNESNVKVDCVVIRLERRWIINTSHYKYSRKSDIVYKTITGTEKHTTRTRVVKLQVPDTLMILNFKYCKVITETFTLHVEAIGCDVARVAFNVMLGNVPLITASDAHQNNQTFQHTIQKYCSYKSVPTTSFPFVD
ncbi:arrestin domain-containing protein 2-like isoform X2 [Myzus persicae]|uniref:arrestin domain-containing protein 2-like isoform X2 n=1 Tax=Myzus persicae TaxID=13164 RepID=UPI000B9305E2|nr:arrestin domain-containing protein 2-like isoform X2 [Myzus persicae]XP_022183393.1 arrestin domain-containing protein 2-like isoform X2 [Myzus persicae]